MWKYHQTTRFQMKFTALCTKMWKYYLQTQFHPYSRMHKVMGISTVNMYSYYIELYL